MDGDELKFLTLKPGVPYVSFWGIWHLLGCDRELCFKLRQYAIFMLLCTATLVATTRSITPTIKLLSLISYLISVFCEAFF